MRPATLITCLMLALVVLTPFASGSWLFLHLLHTQSAVKMRLEKGIGSENLILLDIPKSEIDQSPHFVRIHAREFIYHGQMYDVVSMLDMECTIRYVVFPDNAETKLRRKLAGKMDQHRTKSLVKIIERIANLQWFVGQYEWFLMVPSYKGSTRLAIVLPENKGYPDINLQPPNFYAVRMFF